ncbi:MAG: LLM class flavin-dependent oxidoreductase [Candidatus Thorarchaeota archaeon]
MPDFGIQIEPQFGYDFKEVVEIARIGRGYGFSTLWFSDHFMLDADATNNVLLDPWLLMTALAMEDKKIRVGSLVFCNNYRQPALHAKMAATLDVLSEGRLEFGFGAGWKKLEYNAYGYEFPRYLARIEQMEEAVEIIKGIWSHEKFSYEGKHYQVNDVVSFPKPAQKPRPTIWIGTNRGGDKMIDSIAKHGDGINFAWGFTAQQLEVAFGKMEGFAAKHGREPGEIKRSVGLWTGVFADEDEMEKKLIERAEKRGISLEEYRERVASSFWGTPDMLVEKLRDFLAMDISHFIFMFPYEEEKEQARMLGERVLKRI